MYIAGLSARIGDRMDALMGEMQADGVLKLSGDPEEAEMIVSAAEAAARQVLSELLAIEDIPVKPPKEYNVSIDLNLDEEFSIHWSTSIIGYSVQEVKEMAVNALLFEDSLVDWVSRNLDETETVEDIFKRLLVVTEKGDEDDEI